MEKVSTNIQLKIVPRNKESLVGKLVSVLLWLAPTQTSPPLPLKHGGSRGDGLGGGHIVGLSITPRFGRGRRRRPPGPDPARGRRP